MHGTHANALTPGHKLNEYAIEAMLGEGGFGITYLVLQTALGKRFAVKEYLPRDIAHRDAAGRVAPISGRDSKDYAYGLDRFLEEARLLARFRHPNIVQVQGFFEANGTAYLVMDYENGESLGAHLERHGSLSEPELRAILFPLLDGLSEVHRAGVLHRDIKPDNIYLREDGSAVLLDFGAARHALSSRSRSLTTIVTPGFAPYEQYYTGGEQGPAADIYALGATLYMAMTGKRPPEAPSRLKKDTLVPAARAVKSGYSAAFLKAVDAALAVDADKRPKDVEAWRALFGPAGAAHDEETVRIRAKPSLAPGEKETRILIDPDMRPVSDETPTVRPRQRRLTLAAGVVIAVVIVAGGSGVVNYFESGPDSETAAWKARQTDPPAGACDRLAAHPEDPDKKAAGVADEGLAVQSALAACKAAVAEYPNAPRLHYQYCRTLTRVGSHSTALYHCTVAAGKDYAMAFFALGSAYFNGLGTDRDYVKARSWWLKAAERDIASAQTNVGLMYAKGQGVPGDHLEAIKWWRKAAAAGSAVAQYNLAIMHRKGWGVEQDDAQAVKLLTGAAHKGYAAAQNELAIMYRNGLGVVRNYTEALRWYRKAADQGFAAAHYNLGLMFYDGIGVNRDYREARYAFREAARRGLPQAQYQLGRMYARGVGVTANLVRAHLWFSLAAARGDRDAADARAALERRMSAADIARARELASAWKPKIN